jgi:large conductance mechanosensitive channel
MSKQLKGFMDFVREQGVVGLAVGLAIGAAAGDAVKAIVDNLINPLVGLILGGTDLSNIASKVDRGGKVLTFGWGNILNSVITLLAVAAVVYFLVHMLKLDKADKKA